MPMPKGSVRINVNDVIGKQVGSLKVLKYEKRIYKMTEGGERVRHFYLCQCKCNKLIFVERGSLLNGVQKSCGCSRRKLKHDKNAKQ